MTKQKQGELLSTQNNVGETHKETSSPLVNEEIPNTPFRIHGIENEWFITLGDYRITKNFLTETEALAHLETHLWNVVLQMIGTALDRFDQKQWQNKVQTEPPTSAKPMVESLDRITQLGKEAKP